MPRRLLIITYHYPPDGAVGGLRWAGMTRALSELGWSSWVLTAAKGTIPDVPGVTVTRCPRGTTLNDRYLALRTAAKGADPPTAQRAPESRSEAPSRSPLRAAVSTAGLLLTMPDIGRGWILRAAAATRRLIRTVKPDALITSGPPHSAHVVGRLACIGGGPPRFVDLRDPIVSLADPAPTRVHALTWSSIDRFSLPAASGAICVTPESAAELASRHPRLRIAHIPNGVDLSALPAGGANEPLERLSLAHVGTLYRHRDPRVALRAMHRFLERTPAARGALKFRLVGGVEPSFLDTLTTTCRELDLEGNVEVTGQLPRTDALDITRRSRITLVFAQAQVVHVPAKLYEAAALSRDVIVITEPDSASAREAIRVGASVVAPNDHEALAHLLERAWRGETLNDRSGVNAAAIEYRSIAPQLAEMLENATGN